MALDTAYIDLSGLQSIIDRLDGLANIDPTPLLDEWCRIIVEDNRKGVLAGKDKDDQPVKPVTYRTGLSKPTRARIRRKFGTAAGRAKGGVNGNLTSAQYRKLTGPPLAPRRDQSRIIANLVVGHAHDGESWQAFGAWNDVVRPDGLPLLPPHFRGEGVLPRRDMAGVRAWGRAEARQALVAFLKALLAAKTAT